MLVKRLDRGLLEVVCGGAGGVELAEQGDGLAAHRLLDERQLAHLLSGEGFPQSGCFGVDAALPPGLAQQAAQLGGGELRRGGGGGGGGQDGPRAGPVDPAAHAGEGGQEGGVVLAQVGAELVVAGGAGPDGVLLGPGGELGVGGQRPVGVPVGAQHAGQHDCVAVVGLAARDAVPVPVAGHRHRVDRVDLAAGAAQAGGQQPARGLDRHRDRVLGAVAVLGQQAQQLGQPGRVVADPAAGQQRAVPVYQGDVVVVLGPVDAAEHIHKHSSPCRLGYCLAWPGHAGSRTLPNGRALRHRHPISRS